MDYYIGQICFFAFDFAPVNFVACDGQLLEIEENTALYSLIGNSYGGNYPATFAVPTLQPPTSQPGFMGNWYMCTMGIYPPRP